MGAWLRSATTAAFIDEPTVDESARTLRWEHGQQRGDRFELLPAGDGTLLRVTR